MVEVIVFAEGQTEEKFLKQVVAPALRPSGVYLKARTLSTSPQARGGAVTIDRLKFHARNTLRQPPMAILSSFLDLYALSTDFPSFNEAKKEMDVLTRVQCLETALHQAIIAHADCRPDRFLPHIQPYEFEGLLFSDVAALSRVEPDWSASLHELNTIRSSFATPEHINGDYATTPSRLLEGLLHPKYHKTRHGPLAAERITLEVMERECLHFKTWMDRLRGLKAK